jgi:PKD repeat protein
MRHGCLSLARLWLIRRAGRVKSRATNSADSLLNYTVTLGWEDSMRSIPLMAATTVILAAAWACGGDGGGVEPNNDPVANFTGGPCTVGVACGFADLSTDPDGDNTITTRTWNWGDGSLPESNLGPTPTHTFQTAGTPTVTLTVTDNGGKSNTKSLPITVSGGTPTNNPPTAGFTGGPCVVNVDCQFSDTSTDTDGTITGWSWNFGDGTPVVTGQASLAHRFAAAGTYQVMLTVTDNGGATAQITQSITVSAASASDCSVSGSVLTCEVSVTTASHVTVALTGSDCELGGNNLSVMQPYGQAVFFNICSLVPGAPGTTKTLVDATGAPVLITGSLRFRFQQGTASAGSPTPGAPAGHIEGTFPNWTISIDDGGNPSGPGEPDFTDVIFTVTAAP